MIVVAVDGNIGSGKSTVLEALAAGAGDPGWTLAPEPVASWTLLDKFYEDRRAYALPFNLEVLASFADLAAGWTRRGGDADAKAGVAVVVVERSPLTTRDVFARLLVNEGVMSDADWAVYKRYHDAIGWEPDAIVFVEAPPAACHARMLARGRACEARVTLEYLERVDRAYDTLLRFAKVPVARVDGSQPATVVAQRAAQAIRTLTAAAASPPAAQVPDQ